MDFEQDQSRNGLFLSFFQLYVCIDGWVFLSQKELLEIWKSCYNMEYFLGYATIYAYYTHIKTNSVLFVVSSCSFFGSSFVLIIRHQSFIVKSLLVVHMHILNWHQVFRMELLCGFLHGRDRARCSHLLHPTNNLIHFCMYN